MAGRSSLATCALLGGALGLVMYACAPSPQGGTPAPAPSSTTPAVVSASPTPTPTPTTSPSATAKPGATATATPAAPPTTTSPGQPTGSTSLLAGTNHSEAAKAWVYPAKDVQRWIRTPGQGAQPSGRMVFLTFDDGPSSMTPKVLDALKAKGVHATFFIIGSQVKGNEAILQRAIREGHSVAIHTFGHKYGYLYPGRNGNMANILADRSKAEQAVRTALGDGYFSSAYRYPGGHMSWKSLGASDSALASAGIYWIDWNAMTGDAEPAATRPKSVPAMVAMATAPAKAGTRAVVVLAHDTPDKRLTLQSLPQIIEAYKAKGYSFGVIN